MGSCGSKEAVATAAGGNSRPQKEVLADAVTTATTNNIIEPLEEEEISVGFTSQQQDDSSNTTPMSAGRLVAPLVPTSFASSTVPITPIRKEEDEVSTIATPCFQSKQVNWSHDGSGHDANTDDDFFKAEAAPPLSSSKLQVPIQSPRRIQKVTADDFFQDTDKLELAFDTFHGTTSHHHGKNAAITDASAHGSFASGSVVAEFDDETDVLNDVHTNNTKKLDNVLRKGSFHSVSTSSYEEVIIDSDDENAFEVESIEETTEHPQQQQQHHHHQPSKDIDASTHSIYEEEIIDDATYDAFIHAQEQSHGNLTFDDFLEQQLQLKRIPSLSNADVAIAESSTTTLEAPPLKSTSINVIQESSPVAPSHANPLKATGEALPETPKKDSAAPFSGMELLATNGVGGVANDADGFPLMSPLTVADPSARSGFVLEVHRHTPDQLPFILSPITVKGFDDDGKPALKTSRSKRDKLEDNKSKSSRRKSKSRSSSKQRNGESSKRSSTTSQERHDQHEHHHRQRKSLKKRESKSKSRSSEEKSRRKLTEETSNDDNSENNSNKDERGYHRKTWRRKESATAIIDDHDSNNTPNPFSIPIQMRNSHVPVIDEKKDDPPTKTSRHKHIKSRDRSSKQGSKKDKRPSETKSSLSTNSNNARDEPVKEESIGIRGRQENSRKSSTTSAEVHRRSRIIKYEPRRASAGTIDLDKKDTHDEDISIDHKSVESDRSDFVKRMAALRARLDQAVGSTTTSVSGGLGAPSSPSEKDLTSSGREAEREHRSEKRKSKKKENEPKGEKNELRKEKSSTRGDKKRPDDDRHRRSSSLKESKRRSRKSTMK